MKLSDFVLTHTTGKHLLNLEFFADVSVTTGALWWKHTARREIRRKYIGEWYFVDTGEFTPSVQAEALYRSYTARLTQPKGTGKCVPIH